MIHGAAARYDRVTATNLRRHEEGAGAECLAIANKEVDAGTTTYRRRRGWPRPPSIDLRSIHRALDRVAFLPSWYVVLHAFDGGCC